MTNRNRHRILLASAIAETTVVGGDGTFAAKFVETLNGDITMPHDTLSFDIVLADGITTITVVATVAVKAPEVG